MNRVLIRSQFLVKRQGKRKNRSFSFFALNPNLAAVGFDDHLADDESKAGPFLCGNGGAACLAVLLKKIRDPGREASI